MGGLLPTVASLLWSTGSRCGGSSSWSTWASVVVAHNSVVVAPRISCSTVCGIFANQGLSLCPLHRQADSYPLYHQGKSPEGFKVEGPDPLKVCPQVGTWRYMCLWAFPSETRPWGRKWWHLADLGQSHGARVCIHLVLTGAPEVCGLSNTSYVMSKHLAQDQYRDILSKLRTTISIIYLLGRPQSPSARHPCIRKWPPQGLVVQWLRIHVVMQAMQVWSLVWEDSTCMEQLSPCVTTTETAHLEPVLCNKRSHCN